MFAQQGAADRGRDAHATKSRSGLLPPGRTVAKKLIVSVAVGISTGPAVPATAFSPGTRAAMSYAVFSAWGGRSGRGGPCGPGESFEKTEMQRLRSRRCRGLLYVLHVKKAQIISLIGCSLIFRLLRRGQRKQLNLSFLLGEKSKCAMASWEWKVPH